MYICPPMLQTTQCDTQNGRWSCRPWCSREGYNSSMAPCSRECPTVHQSTQCTTQNGRWSCSSCCSRAGFSPSTPQCDRECPAQLRRTECNVQDGNWKCEPCCEGDGYSTNVCSWTIGQFVEILIKVFQLVYFLMQRVVGLSRLHHMS